MRLDTQVARYLGIDGKLTFDPQFSRVQFGPARFDFDVLGYTDANGNEVLALYAVNKDFLTARKITRAQMRDLEDVVDRSFHPDPWGDAHALQAMSRHWLGVDSRAWALTRRPVIVASMVIDRATGLFALRRSQRVSPIIGGSR